MKKIPILLEDENGDDIEYDFPSKMEVCFQCKGYGTYFSSDVPCTICNGARVVSVIDTESLSEEDKMMYDIYIQEEEYEKEYEYEIKMERMMRR